MSSHSPGFGFVLEMNVVDAGTEALEGKLTEENLFRMLWHKSIGSRSTGRVGGGTGGGGGGGKCSSESQTR